MKKNILTKSVFAVLLLASTLAVAEEQYPATDFQPTVVYSDASASSDGSSADASSGSEATVVAASEDKSEKAESSNTFLLGLVVLAVAGGFFLSSKPKSKCKGKKASSADSSYSGETNGLTGVEKYLQAQNASAATGVEKYLAKKEVADKEASLTGVDKYLRDRG